jgi:protein required for attachment to host cells
VVKHRWVVIADSAQGRIMQFGSEGLELVESFEHPASQESNRDLIGNRPGQNQHGMEKDLKGNEPHALHADEALRFAKQLGNFLATAHAQNRFADLVLVADPKFLGLLRGELSRPVASCVSASINRRALGMKPREVAELVGASSQSA